MCQMTTRNTAYLTGFRAGTAED